MTRQIRALISTGGLLFALFAGVPSLAQKSGGVLHVHALDSPPSLSMHEEVDAVPARAMMGVFNHLVVFDQHIKQNSMQSIVPDLATGWSWSEDGTQLTFPLREGIKWHDGRPFTAKDVKCTWDLLTGKSREKLRLNPAQVVVWQPRRGDSRWRPRGHISLPAAAAGLPRTARLRVLGRLSLSRAAGGNAAASDRYRPVQIRRVQALAC